MRYAKTITALSLSMLLALTGCGGDDDSDESTETTAAAEADDTTDDPEADDAESDDAESDDEADDTSDDTEADDTEPEPGALTEEQIEALCEEYASVGTEVCVADGGPMNVPYEITIGEITAQLVLFVDDAYRTGVLTVDNPGVAPVCDVEVTAVEDDGGAEMFAAVTGDSDASSTCAPPNFGFNVEFPSDLVLSPGDTFTLFLDGAEAGAFAPLG